MKHFLKRKKFIWITVASLFICFFFFTDTLFAASNEEIKRVLLENYDIFQNNDVIVSAIHWIGWMLVKILASIGGSCAELFDKAFMFVDFTTYPQVAQYIEMFDLVFIALICLSLLALGIILIFWHEKKPKLAMNLLIAVLVVSSGSEIIFQMNQFLANDVRGQILGQNSNSSSDMVYEMVGSSIYDLKQLDRDIGLMNLTETNRKTLERLTKREIDLIDINEIVKPDEVSDASKDLMGQKLEFYVGENGEKSEITEIYNGVAWTDLLNGYYYRYNVNWILCIIGMLAVIIVYFCMAYKVVRILYEIVIHHIMAVLYSANLSNSQKTLKILDGIKDSYITLILVLICVKIFNIAYYFINNMAVGGFTKAFLLLFVAFAVADGPNIIQKITGIDAGLSSGFGKFLAMSQAAKATSDIGRGIGRGISNLGGALKNAWDKAGSNAAANFEPTDAYKQGNDVSGHSESADSEKKQQSNAYQDTSNQTAEEEKEYMEDSEQFSGRQELNEQQEVSGRQELNEQQEVSGRQEFVDEATRHSEDGSAGIEKGEFPGASSYDPEQDSSIPYEGQGGSTEMERDLGGVFEELGSQSGYDDLEKMEQDLSHDFEMMDSGLSEESIPNYQGDLLEKEEHLGSIFDSPRPNMPDSKDLDKKFDPDRKEPLKPSRKEPLKPSSKDLL